MKKTKEKLRHPTSEAIGIVENEEKIYLLTGTDTPILEIFNI